MSFDPFAIDSVRKLRRVENQFVQVLITKFKLERRAGGVELSVAFNLDAPTITMRATKIAVQQAVPNFTDEAYKLQGELDDFLLNGKGDLFEYSNGSFPFRYASGGALPIVRWKEKDYYCLFYRDILPIGWNIANGGCLTREELLNPLATMERELAEELVVANRFKHTIGIFSDANGRPILTTRPQGTNSAWRSVLGETAHLFENSQVATKWSAGPDRLKVDIAGECNQVDNCFVNINAADFGIEIDKVIKIAPDLDCALIDGEQTGSLLVNRLVGLFALDKAEGHLRSKGFQFVPDLFFLSGQIHAGSDFPSVVNEQLLPCLKELRSSEEIASFESAVYENTHLNLCPVSRQILARYLQQASMQPGSPCVVFISYGGADEDIARKLYDELRHVTSTFFFPEYLHRDVLSRSIDDALDSARCLIVVGSALNNICRDRCAYEWRRFCQEWSANLKPSGTVILPFISSDLNPEDLPRELREHFVVPFRPASFDKDVQELAKRIPAEFRRSAAETSAGR